MPNTIISLSSETQEQALKLVRLDSNNETVTNLSKNPTTNLEPLIRYLTPDTNSQQDKQLKLAEEMLKSALLKDIEKKFKSSLGIPEENKKKDKNKRKFWLLAITGAIFFACEGFDGIASVFSLVAVSGFISVAVALGFSVLSMVVFFGFGLKQIAENLGVKIKDTPGLVNEYVIQMDEIERSLKTVEQLLNQDNSSTSNQLDDYLVLLTMLHCRLSHIKREKEKLDEAKNKTSIKILKTALSVFTGIIFFSGGFFTGQAVAVAIATLFVTVSVSFPPIFAAAAFIGLLAFLAYWYIERPGIENLIGRKVGLDDDKLEKLGTERTDNTENTINSLQSRIKEKQRLQQVELERDEAEEALATRLHAEERRSVKNEGAPLRVSRVRHSLFQPVHQGMEPRTVALDGVTLADSVV